MEKIFTPVKKRKTAMVWRLKIATWQENYSRLKHPSILKILSFKNFV